jgi:hypothetical protein
MGSEPGIDIETELRPAALKAEDEGSGLPCPQPGVAELGFRQLALDL